MPEAKQDFFVEPFEGKNPQDTAKKLLDDNLESVKDGYDGYDHGSTSLQNRATRRASYSAMKDMDHF